MFLAKISVHILISGKFIYDFQVQWKPCL